MSRRKQLNPQQITLEEDQGEQQLQQLAPEFEDGTPLALMEEWDTPVNSPENVSDLNTDEVMVKKPRWGETYNCEKCHGDFLSFSKFLEHVKNCIKQTTLNTKNDSERLVPSEDAPGVMQSHQPHSSSSKDSDKEDGGSSRDMEEKPREESVLHLQTESAMPPKEQDLSHLYNDEAANTNNTLQAPQGTRVVGDQQRVDTLPAPLPSPSNIPWVLEQILCLQQQQLQQMQLTEQIRIQVNTWATQAQHSGLAAADTLKTFGNQISQQVSVDVALINQKAGSQGLSLDTLKQAELPHTSIPYTTSSVSPGLLPFSLRPDESREVLRNCLPADLLPQAPGPVLFQGPLSTMESDMSKKGKGPPSMFPVDVKPRDEAILYKYKCKYCSRVFETDNSLRIHLRFHTGERPFVCSVCGHQFTTKGNLKAHFNQHLQENAKPQLFVESHNKMASGIGVPCAFPVPIPIGESSLSLYNKPGMVTVAPSVGLSQNLSWGTNPKDQMGGPLPSDLQYWPSPEGPIFSGVGPNYNAPRIGSFQGKKISKPGSETMTLQQLLEKTDKVTTNPNECPICQRVFSRQSSLKVHYRTHTGQKPFKCKTCDRTFSTKSNLKTHLRTHQTNTPVHTQPSCPICQKKFANTVILQQHMQIHTGSQISSTLPPGNPCDFTLPEPVVAGRNDSVSAISLSDVKHTNKVSLQNAPSSSWKVPMPLPSIHSALPMPGFTMMAPLCAPGRVDPAPVILQQQSSRGNSSVACGGFANNSLSSVTGNLEYPRQSPNVLGTVSFQAFSPANSQAENINFKSDAGGRAKSSGNSHSEIEGWSSFPSTFVQFQPTHVKIEVPGAFGPTTMAPGIPSLAALSGQQGNQHGCVWVGKNYSSANSLQIHESTYTRENPFMYNISGQVFPTRDNLQAHYMTHGANSSSASCGRKPAISNTVALSGTEVKRVPEMLPQEITVPSVNVDPVMLNQSTTMVSSGPALETSKTSVNQSRDIPIAPVFLEASSVIDNTTVSKTDGSQ